MAKMNAKYLKKDAKTLKSSSAGELEVKLAADAIEAVGDGLKIKEAGITNAKLAGNIAFEKLADSSVIARTDEDETITGKFSFSTAPKMTVAPVEPQDIVNKLYVDAIAQGIKPKDSCRLFIEGAVTLSGFQTLQGVTLEDGDRVAVQNDGIYVVHTGAWTRSADMSVGTEARGVNFFVEQGDKADHKLVVTNDKGHDIVGTDVINFSIYSSLESAQGAKGVKKVGDTFILDVVPSESHILTASDISAKKITLNNIPAIAEDVKVVVVGAPEVINGVDFTVTSNELSWAGSELDGLLEEGEEMIVKFIYA